MTFNNELSCRQKETNETTQKNVKSPDNCLPYFRAIKKYARDRSVCVCICVYVCASADDDDDDDDNDDNSVK